MDIARNIQHGISAASAAPVMKSAPYWILTSSRPKVLYTHDSDRPSNVLAGIAGVFRNNNVSIASVIQKTSSGQCAELILITHKVQEVNLRDSLAVLQGMSIVGRIDNVIRLEGTHRVEE